MIVETRRPDRTIVADFDPEAVAGELFEVIDELQEISPRRRPSEEMYVVRHEAVGVDAGAEFADGFTQTDERDVNIVR